MLSNWYKKYSSQPHQPFFTNGIVLFIIFLLIVGFQYSGIANFQNSIFILHAYPMIHIVLVQFFLGFLFVVFPKFLMQADLKKQTYMNRYFLYLIGSILYVVSLFFDINITKIAIIILLIASIISFKTLFDIYKKSVVTNKYDMTWVLVAFSFGILSNVLFFLSTFDFSLSQVIQKFSINLGFYSFIFALIFTISQRMIPFFTTGKVPNYKINKSKYILEISFLLLGLKAISSTINYPIFSAIINLALFSFFTYELLKWKLPVLKTTAIMWILYLALLWIPIGFFISFTESISELFNIGFFFEQAPLHIIAIGYFVTALIGFGTRVTLGHSGKIPTADKMTIAIFWSIQLIVFIRFFAGISLNYGLNYPYFIALSAFLLVFVLLVWSYKYLLVLVKGI
ncbi:MAG: NnrS family protein [Epsilonproteobacteria bacterium]|nr:NnrS family protein [Campylobacterota bacterium]